MNDRDLTHASANMERPFNGVGVLSGMPSAEDEKKPGLKKVDYSFAMMVPGAGLEPALPLPGKGF